jgi:exopolysaccharide production protein ExoQ
MSTTLAPSQETPVRTSTRNGDPFLFRRARTWWLLLTLFLMAQGNGIFTVAATASQKAKSLTQFYATSNVLALLTVAMWAICGGLMVHRIRPTLRLLLSQRILLAFVILAFLSTFWSQDPSISFRKAALLFLYFVFGLFFATSYTPDDQMRLFLATGVIVGLTSTAMAVFLPHYGLDAGGEWKGIFGQKNELGYTTFVLFSGLVFSWIQNSRQLFTLALQAIFPIALIVLSRSKESLVLVALLIAVRFYGPFVARRRREQLPFTLYATALSVVAIALARSMILLLLGRDTTLTGRTREWAILFPFALKHFWLGYGYSAFWTRTGDSLSVLQTIGGAIRGSDSGYLDTMLQVGIVGTALWLGFFLVSAQAIAKTFRRPSAPLTAYWYAGLMIATFAESFVGSVFLVQKLDSFAVVVAYAGLTIHKELGNDSHVASGKSCYL